MVQLYNVTASFDRHTVLEGVSLDVHPGEFVSVVGASGTGKSTLLRLLYMDLMPRRGLVRVGEYSSDTITRRQIPYLRRKLGIVFQDFKLLEDRSAFENVAFAMQVTGAKSSEITKKVMNVMGRVGLSHRRSAMPRQLSGGEQQRVAIARALVNEPFLLLADEPTGNLDPLTSYDILKLLVDINTQGTAVIMTTHNYELVRKSKGRIVQLKDKKAHEVQLKA
ncbi:MAG: cell division ATP-binding protein FtsE [Acidobacteriota bacterium]